MKKYFAFLGGNNVGGRHIEGPQRGLLEPVWWQLARVDDASIFGQSLRPSRKLAVLYAGHPESPRAAAYVGFLREWFARVDQIDLEKLNVAAAQDYDVVVADWKRRYGGKGGYDSDSGHRATIGSDFTKPIVMIGAVGGELARDGKIGWL